MITLIDSSPDSLTVSWPSSSSSDETSSTKYILQYRKATEDSKFETLSDKLSSTQARKKNLVDENGVGYLFRVAVNKGNDDEDWVTHPDPYRLLSPNDEQRRLSAPTVTNAGSTLAVVVSWKEGAGGDGTGYELQMRENIGGAGWETIAPNLSGTSVKKKNLTSSNGYQFRVRPNNNNSESTTTTTTTTTTTEFPFSPPSTAFVAMGLSAGMKRFFYSLEDNQLLKKPNQPPAPLEDVIGGKEFVLLYASAHWCPPCRQFTPQLIQWYNSLGPNKPIEVVFLSADHDENGFNSYYGSMPWAAIPFDDDGREAIMGQIRVQGIPRLAVLDGRTGKIVEDNAVGKPFDIQRWRRLAAS